MTCASRRRPRWKLNREDARLTGISKLTQTTTKIEPRPVADDAGFTSFSLHPDLLRGIADMGFTRPTPIQKDAIPPALAGRDVLACAMTGSGKTAAFVLPILQQLLSKRRGKTRALILTPTRELAAQIADHLESLATHTPLSGAAIFGGVGMGPQEHAIRRGVDVIAATPGRLLDHFQYPYAKFESVEILVLDEADRMLDMGFLPDIRRVLAHLPPKRQTLFFSATLPPEIVELSREMLKNPAAINVDRRSSPATGITHVAYPVRKELKSSLLVELLRRGSIESALVFTRTKHRANRLNEFLRRHGIESERIHGNRSQNQRTEALDGFKTGRFPILVATDIAARGIDVEAISHVVNFDVPELAETYIHRVGRTARASATGDALTLVGPDEEGNLRLIEKVLGMRIPRLTLEGFNYTAPAEKLEIPIAERLAAARAQRGKGKARVTRRPPAASKTDSSSRSHTPPSTSRSDQTGGGYGRRGPSKGTRHRSSRRRP